MNRYSIILATSTFICGLLHAADTKIAPVAQAIQQVTIVEKTAAVVTVLSPSRRSNSTPPRSATPPMGQSHKRFGSHYGSYPGRGGSGAKFTMAPVCPSHFSNI